MVERRIKSPRYPAISLSSAVARSGELLGTIGLGPFPRPAAIRGMGRSPKSSGGQRTLAALLAFGLWERAPGGRVRMSDLGRRLLDPENPDSVGDLRAAALSPRIHRRVWERWPDELPADDATLGARLAEWGFNPDAIGPFLSELRETFAFARVYPRGESVARGGEGIDVAIGGPAGPRTDLRGGREPDRVELTALRLAGGCRVVLEVQLPIPPAELRRLATIQGLLEEALAEHLAKHE